MRKGIIVLVFICSMFFCLTSCFYFPVVEKPIEETDTETETEEQKRASIYDIVIQNTKENSNLSISAKMKTPEKSSKSLVFRGFFIFLKIDIVGYFGLFWSILCCQIVVKGKNNVDKNNLI